MSSDSDTRTRHTHHGAFHRLVRSMSGRNDPDSSLTTGSMSIGESDATMSVLPVLPESKSSSTTTTGKPLQRMISNSSSTTKKRPKISERLKQLGKDIAVGKLRKHSDKSVPASPRISVGEVSPGDIVSASSASSSGSQPAQTPGHTKLLSMVAEAAELDEADIGGASPKSPSDDPPEASTLAKRIQALVDSLPFPTPGQRRSIPIVKDPKSPARDDDGRPVPPPDSTPIQDSRLINFLSSPTIMNGSTVKGRPSIWSVLERIGAPAHSFPPAHQGAEDDTTGDESHSDSEEHSIYSDNSSVMVYSPLIPSLDDHVELAELVPVEQEEAASESQTAIEGTSWTTVWPLSIWYGPSSQPTASAVDAKSHLSGEIVLSRPRTSLDRDGNVMRTQTARAWVPSTTKLSVQAMWWGYRIYLPPPVLEILSDKTLEATKRAAMITTALTWFFNHLPVDALPPPVRPAALLLQRLAPFLGYIGTFISWSWSTIKSYDVGFGVTLTATWLLPVALIPGTWRENDFPKSPTQSLVPLPPASPPASPPTSLPTLSMSSPPPTSPTLSYVTANETITSPNGMTSVSIPIPPIPVDIPPVPPSPILQAVPVGSPLMEQLLQGPVLGPVPLPDENAPSPVQPYSKPKKDRKSRAKILFTRSPRH
ncbi:hypothetical protein CVT25_003552 [Psilocybe cyanescens]|uniref:Uncharacterized protein n=1 Tax=Psilocybe cyanescens TaxID=93625 RepID=A0A409WNY3_PSICY|nr:hypothetical protein CVT25_003552 [Psilocybe cyanescens]